MANRVIPIISCFNIMFLFTIMDKCFDNRKVKDIWDVLFSISSIWHHIRKLTNDTHILGYKTTMIFASLAAVQNITQTCPCNILQYFTAIKMIFLDEKL